MFTCCCTGCRTGYPVSNTSNKNPSSTKATKVSLHIFPKDEELKKMWLRSIKRNDFVPSRHSRVCSRHFQESCFVLEHQNFNNSRSKNNRLSSMKLAMELFRQFPGGTILSVIIHSRKNNSLCDVSKK
ncbi:THAP domaincontaining protein 5like, partial [Caligus rogercresseyi]